MKNKKSNFEVDKNDEANAIDNKQEHSKFIQTIQSLKRLRLNKTLIIYLRVDCKLTFLEKNIII